MASFTKEAAVALVFAVLYFALAIWMATGYATGRYKLRSRWSLLAFHITVRVASQVRSVVGLQVGWRCGCASRSMMLIMTRSPVNTGLDAGLRRCIWHPGIRQHQFVPRISHPGCRGLFHSRMSSTATVVRHILDTQLGTRHANSILTTTARPWQPTFSSRAGIRTT